MKRLDGQCSSRRRSLAVLAREFADPAVRSGLLTFEVRPWLAGLHR